MISHINHQTSSSIISHINHQPLSIIIHHQPSSAINNHHQPSSTILTIINRFEPSWTIMNHCQPLSAIINHRQPSSTIVNHFQPLSTNVNHCQPLASWRICHAKYIWIDISHFSVAQKIVKSWSGHLSGSLPDPRGILLIPRMVSISDFDDTIGLSHAVHRNWCITLPCSTKIVKSRSGHFSRTLPDPWRISLILRMMSISDFDHTIGFVYQSTNKMIYHTSL